MPQTGGRLFDGLGKLMEDAVGVADSMRREVDTIVRDQAERILGELDLVRREEFEAVREMAALARAENERLAARLAALEARLGTGEAGGAAPPAPVQDEP
ncbi:MAG TPA: accessory factor UbiK family protein [Hyphomicrobiales bacterium]|nr:accessory factor UbiK family protein [Hyphomicrobiales bacterium]